MLASAVIRAAEVLAVVLAAGTVTLAAGLWWLRRRLRSLKRLGRVTVTRAGLAAAGAAVAGRHRVWSLPLPDRRWLAAARERRRLWQAVGAAERAVTAARQAGAPTGDLDGLCRRLRQAARDAGRRLPLSRQAAAAEIGDLTEAAGQIQDAAASAAAAIARPASRHLAEDARREAQALAAGIAAAGLAGDRR
jgi:hypothetical protein